MVKDQDPLVPSSKYSDPLYVRGIIASLCELWEKGGGEGGDFRAELDATRAVAIHTHAHHAVKMARALLVLDDAHAAAETSPVVRLIFECGVLAAWFLLREGSGHSMVWKGSEDRKKALKEAAALGTDVGASLTEAADAIKYLDEAGVHKGWIFKQQCEYLEGGAQLYVLYRVITMESHAGLGIADMYSISDESSPIGVAFNPDPENSTRASALGVAASMLFLAVKADELARLKPRRTTQLKKISAKLGVGMRIVAANGYELPPR